MIIKELFDKVTFEELFPHLKVLVQAYRKHLVDDIYLFRQAYDRLKLTEPDRGIKQSVKVVCYGGTNVSNIDLSNDLEGIWRIPLAMELVIPKEKCVSLAALAALCLSKLTYDSWSDYAEESPTYRALYPCKPSNRYELALERLENSIYKLQTPVAFLPKDKESRARRDHIVPRGMPFKKFFNKLYPNRMNRSKRKRKFRQEKRKEFLKMMGKKQSMVDKFTMTGSSFKRGSCDYLLHVENGERIRFRSPLMEHALDYIFSSMANYCVLPSVDQFKETIVFVVFKQGQVASSLETDSFKKKVEELLSCSVIYGQAEGDVHETEVTLLMFNR